MVIVDQRYVNASSVITLYESRAVLIFDLIYNTPHVIHHTHKQMVDVAVEGGGISENVYGSELCWGERLGLATEVGSGVVAVSLSLLDIAACSSIISTHISILIISSTLFKLQKSNALEVGLEWGTNWWKGDSGSDVKDVSSLAGEDVMVRFIPLTPSSSFKQVLSLLIRLSLSLTLQDIHELSGGDSGVFADVLWQDSVQVTANSRRDGVVSSEVCRHTYKFLVVVDYNFSLTHPILTELRVS